MKKILISLVLGLGSFASFGLELADVAGVYEVSSPLAPVSNTIEISSKGDVKLTEKSPYGIINCTGKATLANNVLTSKVVCENELEFTQQVRLDGVTDLSQFTALVYSSLYDAELEMNFTRL